MTMEAMMIGILAGCFSSLIALVASWQLAGRLAAEPDRVKGLAKLATHGLTLLLLLAALAKPGLADGLITGATIIGLITFILCDEGLRLDRLEGALAGSGQLQR
jgi:hypothetical protein